jgi:SAM-dependent methyltransferase
VRRLLATLSGRTVPERRDICRHAVTTVPAVPGRKFSGGAGTVTLRPCGGRMIRTGTRRREPTMTPPPLPHTDPRAALAQYRRRAPLYDLELAPFEPVRRRAVERLALRPGDAVIDAGCGTGLSFALLRQAVGPTGRVIGIEQCPEMVERARRRIRDHGWSNVALVQAPAQDARLGLQADAVLLMFTHDVLRRPAAVSNLIAQLRPGAHVSAAGLQWAGWAGGGLNLFVLGAALHSVSSLEGLARPWSRLEPVTHAQCVESMLAGCVFVFSAALATDRRVPA